MKKKLKLFISIVSLVMLSNLILTAEDMPIQANQLPQNAQNFVKTNFPNDQIVYAEQDRQSYKVELASGIEIDFDRTGNWTDVSGNNRPIPTQFIPSNILNAVKAKYPQIEVLDISKEYNSYKLKLANNREVYVSNNGQITGDKLD
ncbi:PepSY-like domain-containing protein [Brachyspira hyodysenteriae]|uniref:PepSY-like domain-containing protein n=1 Tax=Brachyspira hyodysenteriae TaxID=159 RepID=UPI0022CDB669|nr:PepSY-like domain-containing protein [Brachyspira hyodysenteriae]MCZ9839668.1 PepSY-like domain-containing protein [Brachyspira hyodysenteriae]MCZ9847310.1 PepSY-like domain-containing protein [Brachyspira hyodysenteriae]MCZ9851102.1 PepSY-like domain-containing protein [Brachyspira hyodysenteriae]MCZ9860146.1 PepSY-like domain-containing protein [Brachyspira hyodysenteriae]MCZ9869572.1 PepSY-like domain-containing protein [Brachyspira hyodysenteriae]